MNLKSQSTVPLILASTSPYRQNLMLKLGVPFRAEKPLCDEDFFKAKIKDPVELATTLAREKARSLKNDSLCIIGGDQVAALDQEIMGKPLTEAKAFSQLKKLNGKTHRLITAICVIHQGKEYDLLDTTELTMRSLTDREILSYIQRDHPLDCAASYKIEKSGIVLMEEIKCKDFSAIEGIPLIQLSSLLKSLGYELFSN